MKWVEMNTPLSQLVLRKTVSNDIDNWKGRFKEICSIKNGKLFINFIYVCLPYNWDCLVSSTVESKLAKQRLKLNNANLLNI